MDEVKRGPGRPKTGELKKGSSSWKPAAVTEVKNKEDGWRYRWVNKHPDNMAKKANEGWENAPAVVPEGRIEHGQSLTSTMEKHDVVLQRIPEELAKSRDEYFDDKNERRLAGLTSHLKKDVNKAGGEAHGEITISTRRGAN